MKMTKIEQSLITARGTRSKQVIYHITDIGLQFSMCRCIMLYNKTLLLGISQLHPLYIGDSFCSVHNEKSSTDVEHEFQVNSEF